MRKIGNVKYVVAVGAIAALLSGCTNGGSMGGMDHSKMNMNTTPNQEQTKNMTTNVSSLTGKEFTLTAMASNQELALGKKLPVWTFNNSVPGPEIRVKQGETITVNLKNELTEPVSIHWHGVPVPNDMDGIPGITQNAVQPGKTFTYRFKADVAGTYWYHSHQDSVNQVDRGLYGAFIVEPNSGTHVDRDYTLVLDEWMSTGMSDMKMSETDMSDMAGMDHSMNMGEDNSTNNQKEENPTTAMNHDMSMYDLFTINGKSGTLVDKLPVKKGEKIRMRLINAGYLSHSIHLHGHEFKVTATDGQPLNQPGILKDNLVTIAPGERYDIEFEANHPGQWLVEDHSDNKAVKGMKALIVYDGSNQGTDKANDSVQLPAIDLTRYGQPEQATFQLDQTFTQEYNMILNTEMKKGEMVYTINGKAFPKTDPINVKKGDTVKVRFVNKSKSDDHPMHLHGHFFQVLSKNGKPLEGTPLMKDTLNLKPGEEYVVAFQADNEGNWMFHCHDLHHASAGMMTELKYTNYKTDFVPDPKANNIAE